ncbi:MAG: hypothetical protein OEY49_10660, partial [Candidatus Heimdallarchaeota archaeon]|nr:hypothetical protein [Candidatus Heimdallarchaeota archaeon]
DDVDFVEDYRPFLLNATNAGAIETRERNFTKGDGGIYTVNAFENVTINYAIVLRNGTSYDTTTKVKLYADLPIVNGSVFNNTHSSNTELSLTTGNQKFLERSLSTTYYSQYDFQVPYMPDVILPNATLVTFTFVLNMSVDYVPFYAVSSQGASEIQSNSRPYNLLTTANYWTTDMLDDLYFGDEILNATMSYYNSNPDDEFGIYFKKTTEYSTALRNFNQTSTGVDDIGREYTLESFPSGANVELYSYAVVNDTSINITRTINRIDYQIIIIEDGIPQLELEVESTNSTRIFSDYKIYSANASFVFNFTAYVAKGSFSSIELNPGDGTSLIDLTIPIDNNISLAHTYTYADEGEFNATITITTNRGESVNQTYVLVYDESNPTGSYVISNFDEQYGDRKVVSNDNGMVLFEFEMNDSVAGVRYAFLDLGNNITENVLGQTNFTYNYRLGSETVKEFNTTLTLIDWVGNEVSFLQLLRVSITPLASITAPFGMFPVIIIGAVAFFMLPWYGPKISDFIMSKFNK